MGQVTADGEGGSDDVVVTCGELAGSVQITDTGTGEQEVNSLTIRTASADNAFAVSDSQVTWGAQQQIENITYSSVTNLTIEPGPGVKPCASSRRPPPA